MMFLPLASLDPRPSVTVFNCIVLQLVFSAQLLLLQSKFNQQAKDTAIIHKEVLHEYDTKYVHPRLHPVVRDVGTQMSTDDPTDTGDFVEIGTPMTVIKKEFHTSPNPYLPRTKVEDAQGHQTAPLPRAVTPTGFERWPEPSNKLRHSPLRQSLPAGSKPIPTPISGKPSTGVSFGGSMGLFTHANSPLKKATSLSDINSGFFSPRNSREMAAMEQQNSPKKISPKKPTENRRLTTSTLEQTSGNPFQNPRNPRLPQERYPSMW
jgi:hypothetical protein